jgi:hypothetical protein
MEQIINLLKKWLAFTQAHRYYSVGTAVFLVAAITAICLMQAPANTLPVSTKQAAHHTSKTARIDQHAAAAADAASTTSNTATQTPNTNVTGNTKSTPSAVKTLASPANTQGGLILSSSTFTLTPGSSAPITVTASNGAAITYPLGGAVIGIGVNLGPAAPFKTTWSGSAFVAPDVAPGTYTIKLFAQDKTTAGYAGTITINVVQPTMEFSVQSLGYDSQNDEVRYSIHLNRLYGFSESVTSVGAYSPGEPTLNCDYGIVDNNTIALDCGHDTGTGPTSGSLTITVRTASLTRSATASYSLPQ